MGIISVSVLVVYRENRNVPTSSNFGCAFICGGFFHESRGLLRPRQLPVDGRFSCDTER